MPYRRVVLRLMRWKYRCGEGHRDDDLPGADLSFFYGWFLGVSPCADAVAFDTVSFGGFDELKELIGSLGQALPQEDPSRWTARALTEVCDPDTHGDRYVFSGTLGCATCTSMQVESFTDTQEPWEHNARAATHVQWDSMSRPARLDRLRVVRTAAPRGREQHRSQWHRGQLPARDHPLCRCAVGQRGRRAVLVLLVEYLFVPPGPRLGARPVA